jgi:hypothetical protein
MIGIGWVQGIAFLHTGRTTKSSARESPVPSVISVEAPAKAGMDYFSLITSVAQRMLLFFQ